MIRIRYPIVKLAQSGDARESANLLRSVLPAGALREAPVIGPFTNGPYEILPIPRLTFVLCLNANWFEAVP